jgi:hypothetical protein
MASSMTQATIMLELHTAHRYTNLIRDTRRSVSTRQGSMSMLILSVRDAGDACKYCINREMNGCFSRWDRMSRASFPPPTVNMTNSRNPGPWSLLSRPATRLHGPHRCSIVVDGIDVSSRNRHDHQGYQGHQYSVFYQQFGAGKHFTIARQQGQSHDDTAIKHKTVGFGSRSVRDSSTFDRLDSWGKLLVESLERRRRFQCRSAQSLLGCFGMSVPR